jgi:hypothetical protein
MRRYINSWIKPFLCTRSKKVRGHILYTSCNQGHCYDTTKRLSTRWATAGAGPRGLGRLSWRVICTPQPPSKKRYSVKHLWRIWTTLVIKLTMINWFKGIRGRSSSQEGRAAFSEGEHWWGTIPQEGRPLDVQGVQVAQRGTGCVLLSQVFPCLQVPATSFDWG